MQDDVMEEEKLKQFPFLYQKQKIRESAIKSNPLPDEFFAVTFKESPINQEVAESIYDSETNKNVAENSPGYNTGGHYKQSSFVLRGRGPGSSRSNAAGGAQIAKESRRASRASQRSNNQLAIPKDYLKVAPMRSASGYMQDNEEFFQNREFEFIQKLEEKRRYLRQGRFEVHGRAVYYSSHSLFFLTSSSPIRKALVWLVEWNWFDRFILLCIVLNSFLLGIYDYSDRDSRSQWNKVNDNISSILTIIFLLEACIKIIAMGFLFHKFAYLKDNWNLMDFFIVVMGIIDLMQLGVNLKALRILRVMKPLRSLKALPSMRRLVTTLFQSLPEVGNAGIFITFVIVLFAILGLQQFQGIIYYRCRETPQPINSTYWPKSKEFTRVCSLNNIGGYSCPNNLTCGSPIDVGISLEDDGVYNDPQILYAIGSFDNFFQSALAVVQSLTGEDWTTLMYNLSDGYTPFFSKLYFCIIVVIGHYYMLQLILAVIMQNLSKIQSEEAYENMEAKKKIVESDREALKELKKQLASVDTQLAQTDQELITGVYQSTEQQLVPTKRLSGFSKATAGQLTTHPQSPQGGKRASVKNSRSHNNLNIQFNLTASSPKHKKGENGGGGGATPRGGGGGRMSPSGGKMTLLALHQKSSSTFKLLGNGQNESEDVSPSIAGGIIGNNHPKGPKKSVMFAPEQKALVMEEADEGDSDQSAHLATPQSKNTQLTSKQKNLDEKIKKTFMWSLGRQDAGGNTADISKGVGLAMLTKLLGIQKIEQEYQKFTDQIKSSLNYQDLTIRLKMQRKVRNDLIMMGHRMEYEVTKLYHMSKKSVYGIDNELHLVEQVQRSLNVMINMEKLGQGILTFFNEQEIERREQKQLQQQQELLLLTPNGIQIQTPTMPTKELSAPLEYDEPQLNQHMQVALKLAYNLRDISMKQDVRKFFFAKFKKSLIKKNLIEKISAKVDKALNQTEYEIRAKSVWLYEFCFKAQSSSWFSSLSVFAIVCNSIVLMLSKYPIDTKLETMVEYLNLSFFIFFVIELLIKLIGRGVVFYFKEKFNWFDSAVVLISAIDITLQYTIGFADSGSGAITALRIFRLIKVFQLTKVWQEFNQLMQGITNTLKDISNVSILLVILVFTYMLIGMEIYAFKVKFNEETHAVDLSESGKFPRSNFNTPLNAFLSVFIVLANDGWTRIYQDHYRATNSVYSTLFFFSILFVGQFMLLNLFIAILIENFEQLSVRNNLTNKINKIKSVSLMDRVRNLLRWCRGEKVQPLQTKIDQLNDEEHQEMLMVADIQKQQSAALFIFPFESKIRAYSRLIINHKYFEYIIMAVILVSTVQLTMDNPLNNPEDDYSQVLLVMENVLTGIFALEAVLKVISDGFAFCGSKSYIRSYWNMLDFLVLLISIMSYAASSRNLNSIKAFRLLKVLRPLRVISKNQGLRISIQALGVALGSIFNVILVSLLFNCIFGIIGINYFKGKYYDCDYQHTQLKMHIDNKWNCLDGGGEWTKQFMNFDTIGESLYTMFIVSNSVSWADVMYRGASNRGIDLTPGDTLESTLGAIFFVIIIIIGNFFLMNLFVGVIITTYNREKELLGKDFMLTQEQKKWVRNRMMLMISQPLFRMKLPHSDWRQPFYYIAQHWFVQYFILMCIIVNTVILLIGWVGKPQELEDIINMMNFIFAGIFTLEFIVKYIGYGNRFFYDKWNNFDMVIVIITILSILLQRSSSFQMGAQITVIRSFRIARVFSLFKRNRALKGTFQTFVVTLPSLANIGSLLLLIVFIYAILGVYLFAPVKLSGELNGNANFQSVSTAFITLLRIATGEKWPLLIEALSKGNDLQFQCIDNPTYQDFEAAGLEAVGCGSRFFATAYVFSFTMIVTMVFLRLFIAIILQSFQETAEKENKFMNNQLTDHFREAWSIFDPDATSFIKCSLYPRFLVALGEPLGWDASYEHNFLKQQEYLAEINLPKYNRENEYQFMDVLENLILLMIIRREVIHFAIKHKNQSLLGTNQYDASASSAASGENSSLQSSVQGLTEEEFKEGEAKNDEEEEDDDDDQSYQNSEDGEYGHRRGGGLAGLVGGMRPKGLKNAAEAPPLMEQLRLAVAAEKAAKAAQEAEIRNSRNKALPQPNQTQPTNTSFGGYAPYVTEPVSTDDNPILYGPRVIKMFEDSLPVAADNDELLIRDEMNLIKDEFDEGSYGASPPPKTREPIFSDEEDIIDSELANLGLKEAGLSSLEGMNILKSDGTAVEQMPNQNATGGQMILTQIQRDETYGDTSEKLLLHNQEEMRESLIALVEQVPNVYRNGSSILTQKNTKQLSSQETQQKQIKGLEDEFSILEQEIVKESLGDLQLQNNENVMLGLPMVDANNSSLVMREETGGSRSQPITELRGNPNNPTASFNGRVAPINGINSTHVESLIAQTTTQPQTLVNGGEVGAEEYEEYDEEEEYYDDYEELNVQQHQHLSGGTNPNTGAIAGRIGGDNGQGEAGQPLNQNYSAHLRQRGSQQNNSGGGQDEDQEYWDV